MMYTLNVHQTQVIKSELKKKFFLLKNAHQEFIARL